MNKFYIFIFVIIISGLILRLIWTEDMEWKYDEKCMYSLAHKAVDKQTLPILGMGSGKGIENPGMSVWVFAAMALFTDSPVSMNRIVEIINVISIVCFLLFIMFKVKGNDKEIWLSGIALAAISPIAVVYSRKLWAQDVLPIFSFMLIFANANRNKNWGAFLWGVMGAIIGQIHMSGFFLGAGIFVFTVIHDYYNNIKFKWAYWLAGSIAGSISMIPWIIYTLTHSHDSTTSFMNILQFNFYLHWFLQSHGFSLYNSLGKDFWQYIKEPVIYGYSTYIAALIYLFLVGVSVLTLAKIVKIMIKLFQHIKQKTSPVKLFTNINITQFYLLSILLGLGIFMTVSGTSICPHYLICAFPFQYIFLAKILEKRKLILRSVIIAQLIITITFLVYIHKNEGTEKGDYGKAYHSQFIYYF